MKNMIIVAALLGAVGIILGAFGAHSLKEVLSADQLQSFKTGVYYHQLHCLVLLFIALLFKSFPSKSLRWAFMGICLGILLFSGSIYLLATRELIGLENYRWLGPITPIGGSLLIISWVLIATSMVKQKTDE